MNRAGRSLSEWAKIAPLPEMPVWVPEEMKELLAHTLYALTSDLNEVSLLKRMATDPRMKNVWVELMKKNRSEGKGKFFNAKSPPIGIEDGDRWRYGVLETLFRHIFSCGKLCLSEASGKLPKVIERKRDEYDRRAIELDYDTRFVRRVTRMAKGRIRAGFEKRAKQLEKAARAYLEVSVLLGKRFFDSSELVAILFSSSIASKMRDNLGSPKYGTVATIASVVLEREIKPSDVRKWCEGPWGIKRTSGPFIQQ